MNVDPRLFFNLVVPIKRISLDVIYVEMAENPRIIFIDLFILVIASFKRRTMFLIILGLARILNVYSLITPTLSTIVMTIKLQKINTIRSV
ncbi:hypothetical protein KAI60_05105, partial [Candidatus Bathyarchaeota archaeon]|nr:hypothetical protein [Candidatus Bathyarchaeota archaeon]